MVEETQIQEGYQKTEVGIIPYDWNVATISDVAFVISGGTPSTFNNSYWNGNINWFTPTEVGTTKYLFESKRKITKSGLDSSSAKI